MKGLFITFEGPDGSGKTTQIKEAAHYLQQHQCSVVLTREPGGTEISDKIRSILLNPEYNELTDETEVLLYAASRSQHVSQVILPALNEGKVVLCDRFVDASIAYQAYGLGVPVNQVKEINGFATKGLEPDWTFYIDISPEVARKRMLLRQGSTDDIAGLDRIEQKKLDYHARVREGFKTLYEENKQRMIKIDGNQSMDKVTTQVIDELDKIFNLK